VHRIFLSGDFFDDVSAFPQNAGPQKNHNENKAGKQKPARRGSARVERLRPPVFESLQIHLRFSVEYGAMISALAYSHRPNFRRQTKAD